MICRKEILVNTYTALTTDRKFSTHAQRIQGDFALNQFVVHLALVTRSIAGPGNQASGPFKELFPLTIRDLETN